MRRLRAGFVPPSPGGAGAPPAGTTTRREELADGGRPGRLSGKPEGTPRAFPQKRGPAPKRAAVARREAPARERRARHVGYRQRLSARRSPCACRVYPICARKMRGERRRRRRPRAAKNRGDDARPSSHSGARESANPESRNAGTVRGSGFRVRTFGASRNDEKNWPFDNFIGDDTSARPARSPLPVNGEREESGLAFAARITSACGPA